MKRTVLGMAVLLVGVVWLIFAFRGGSWLGHNNERLNLSAEGIVTLDISTSAGSLIIKGDDRADEIVAIADIRRPFLANKGSVKFSLERDGKTARLVSDLRPSFGIWGSSIDITVTVPSSMNIVLKDGSGNLEMSDIAGEVEIEDGSGNMRLIELGNIRKIRDGSGNLLLRNTGGNLVLIDQSGSIEVDGHEGDLDITDGSGDLTVRGLKGNLVLEDGSGDVHVRGVEGNVTVKNDGSGSLSVDEVNGTYTKP